ncbi:hypothetical protein ACFO25_01240 [Paenactinomyces guangxiensis]|uniref:Uncharacterized protein n=1 Tax=Paenactinomyces guangxiensis TaxID=1490290 RepID=A0A7W1WSR0_9BACL|nr:hypothetical protein [Paenactinomyces guangxiensis]MBA4495387.1 hypothetical protein [Paenactinomyces guangxiensis]MBH8592492.1 hypothetical protein [Paenactinomyces guangxiensis]
MKMKKWKKPIMLSAFVVTGLLDAGPNDQPAEQKMDDSKMMDKTVCFNNAINVSRLISLR